MREIMEINKDLMAASSTPIVLAILAEGDSYGYAILRRVREVSGGRMEWTDGMLYPVLHRLEGGRAQLAEERRQWQAVDDTLRGVWRALSLSVPAGHPASAVPPAQGV